MNQCVLDSSVIIKGLFPPSPTIPSPILEREQQTHTKCLHIFKIIEDSGIEIWFPKVCIIEVAAVSRRCTDLKSNQMVTSRIHAISTLISEDFLFQPHGTSQKQKVVQGLIPILSHLHVFIKFLLSLMMKDAQSCIKEGGEISSCPG